MGQNDTQSLMATWLGTVIVFVGLIVFALRPFLPHEVLLTVGAVLIANACFLIARTQHLGIATSGLAGGMLLYAALPIQLFVWPAYFVVPIILAGLVTGLRTGRASFLSGGTMGSLGSREWPYVAIIAIVAGLALVAWVWFLNPDLNRLRAMLPEWPVLGLIAAGVTFSLVNAILEEFIWRGIFLRWFMTFMPTAFAVFVQALSFGAAHYLGFPSGFVGVGLAAIYGLMLGMLAVTANGILAAIVAHIAADAVIFTILAIA